VDSPRQVSYGVYQCHRLYKEGAFEFQEFPYLGVRGVWKSAAQKETLRHKLFAFLVGLHDLRFRGDWTKKTDKAKFFGFFLANTAAAWFFFALPLVKKIFLAAISNIASPLWNATLMTSLQAVDVVVFVVCTLLSGNWGHRDRCVKRETFAFLQQKKRETFAFRKLAQSRGKSISTATDCEEL